MGLHPALALRNPTPPGLRRIPPLLQSPPNLRRPRLGHPNPNPQPAKRGQPPRRPQLDRRGQHPGARRQVRPPSLRAAPQPADPLLGAAAPTLPLGWDAARCSALQTPVVHRRAVARDGTRCARRGSGEGLRRVDCRRFAAAASQRPGFRVSGPSGACDPPSPCRDRFIWRDHLGLGPRGHPPDQQSRPRGSQTCISVRY